MTAPTLVHGSAVLFGETGILIRGDSGSGKSMLILALIAAEPECARLVADDRVLVSAESGRLVADVPPAIAGLIEVRGLGLVKRPHVAPVVIRLVVDLALPDACPRMPDVADTETAVEGIVLPRLFVPIGAADGALRVIAAVGELPRRPG